MKVAGKLLRRIVFSIVVLLLIVVLLFLFFGERAIKNRVETAGSKALGVGVSVNKIDLSIFTGAVGIKGLVVKNPKGYENENLLDLKDGNIDVGLGSLMSDTVHIDKIKLDGMELTIEQKGLTNNLKQILDALPKTEQAEVKPSEKTIVVDELEMTNIKVKVKLLPLPGRDDTIPLDLAPIKMSNLGVDDKLSMAKLVGKILVAVAEGVAKQGAGLLPDDMVKGIGSALGQTLELGGDVLKEGGKILDKGLGVGGGAVDGLKGLLNRKKKKE